VVEAYPAEEPSKTPERRQNNSQDATPQPKFRTFVPPPADQNTVAVARLPEPPTIQPAVEFAPPARSQEFLQPAVQPKTPVPHDNPDSASRVKVMPVATSSAAQYARSIPVPWKRRGRADYVPPVPVRNPAVPEAPHVITQDVHVDVKVYVNAKGKVDFAEVLSDVTAADRDLAAAAIFSARRCEFVPARTTSGPVSGEAVLRYQFAPTAHVAGNPPAAESTRAVSTR
jgi:hypothetical protein